MYFLFLLNVGSGDTGGYGFYHTQGEFPDVWALSEDLRSDIDSVFVSNHYDGFFCKERSQYLTPAD